MTLVILLKKIHSAIRVNSMCLYTYVHLRVCSTQKCIPIFQELRKTYKLRQKHKIIGEWSNLLHGYS
jgi:hypothetical protein